MQSIFISYRREDSEGQAGRLYDDLAARFGEDRVFMDVSGIGAGSDFRKVIEDRVAQCAVLLVVIGKRWLDVRDVAGNRRLDNAADFVRLETVSALRRDGVTVIPVLVGGATMPEAKDLPAELEQLAYRNAAPISHLRWTSDLEVLVAELRRELKLAEDEEPQQPSARQRAGAARRQGRWSTGMIAGAAALVVAGSVGGYVAYDQFSPVRKAEREALVAEATARTSKAMAEKLAADAAAAAASAQIAQVQADKTKLASEQAAATASAAAAAAEKARQDAEKASVEEKAKAEAQARELERQQQEAEAAKKLADQKAAEVQAAAEAASAAAARKAADDRIAQEELAKATQKASEANAKAVRAGAKAAPVVIAPSATSGGSSSIDFTLNACRRFEARARATITIEPDGDGAAVSVQLSGTLPRGKALSGGGRQKFAQRVESYAVPVTVTWDVETPFQTTLTAVVVASGGTRFQTAYARDVRSQCPPGN